MKIYQYKNEQFLPIPITKAWDFFSNPNNLLDITPPWLNFVIKSELPEKMYPGMLIQYRVYPVLGIPNNWITEITHVNEPEFFVDEQRFGPYKFWHHQHIFIAINEGVLMKDIVSYALPLGFLGRLSNSFLVKKKISEIFVYRERILKNKFG